MKRAILSVAGGLFAASLLGQGVKDLDKAWIKAVKAGDADGLTKLYAADAVMYPPDEVQAKGTDAIRASYQKMLSTMNVKDMQLNYDAFRQAGNTSWASGRFTMTMEPKSGGAAQTMEGRFTSVAERKNGKWMYVSDHASVPMAPPPPPTSAAPAPTPTPSS
ncbi:MAG TPA: SgcJ/EcaC family oxidoreductase [Thermoanaerobaculia bacterium]